MDRILIIPDIRPDEKAKKIKLFFKNQEKYQILIHENCSTKKQNKQPDIKHDIRPDTGCLRNIGYAVHPYSNL